MSYFATFFQLVAGSLLIYAIFRATTCCCRATCRICNSKVCWYSCLALTVGFTAFAIFIQSYLAKEFYFRGVSMYDYWKLRRNHLVDANVNADVSEDLGSVGIFFDKLSRIK
jgi:hypothetical protein